MSEGFKLTDREMRYISLFEAATGASIIDCVEQGDLIAFVVSPGNVPKVLAGRGIKVQRFSKLVRKRVKVIEYSDDPAKFLENALLPARVIEPIRIMERTDGRKIAIVTVDPRDKGIAIGKEGRTIELIRLLLRRHHKIDHVVIQ